MNENADSAPTNPVTLIPLSAPHHIALLQAVYDATPDFWKSHQHLSAPQRQAEHDLAAALETPGRTIMGILRRVSAHDPLAGMEMVGMIDMWLHSPVEATVTVGMIMVAQPCQRQGIGRQAWSLAETWLAGAAGMTKAQAAIEQFNMTGLKFFTSLGFNLTGEARRIRMGDQLVRLLTMGKSLSLG